MNKLTVGGLATVAAVVGIGAAVPASVHADEYGLRPDNSCTVSSPLKSATISHQSCIDAFLYEAHMDKLTSPHTDGRSSDDQLLSDGLIACVYGPDGPRHGSGDIDVTAAAVRRIDSTLIGGKPVFGGNEDVPAVDLAWIAVGTLCAGGVT